MEIKDHSISQDVFKLKYIAEYDMYQTYPIPKNIEKYYDSDNYISHTDNHKGFINYLYQFVKKINLTKKLQLIKKYKNTPGKILDIGAGTGDFLLEAQKNCWEVFGVEPALYARKNAEKKGIFLNANQVDLKIKHFDCITLWHSLEHIIDLKNEIEFLSNSLSKNGILIIAVPNFKSWDATHYQKYWAAYDVPRHIWHFSKNSIVKLFSESNFEFIDVKPMWFDSFYISIISEQYKYGRKNIIRGFINGMYSNLYGILKNEYSSQIYILKKNK